MRTSLLVLAFAIAVGAEDSVPYQIILTRDAFCATTKTDALAVRRVQEGPFSMSQTDEVILRNPRVYPITAGTRIMVYEKVAPKLVYAKPEVPKIETKADLGKITDWLRPCWLSEAALMAEPPSRKRAAAAR